MKARGILGACLAIAALAVVVQTAAGRGNAASSGNLIKNGGAELGGAVTSTSSVIPRIPGWAKTGNFTTVRYGAPGGFPDAAISQKINGGKNFFAGGPANPNSRATQLVSVVGQSASIDKGKVTATLSGYLGGYSSQRDSLTVIATFLDGAGKTLGSVRIGPVSPAQRKNETTLLLRSARASVPAKTRKLAIHVNAVRTDGSYNDGYADNLSLTLATGG